MVIQFVDTISKTCLRTDKFPLEWKKANIKRAIDIFDWESALNHIDVNDQVSVFSSTILNIVSNFFPNETCACDDRDPPWINSFIKYLIHAKDS